MGQKTLILIRHAHRDTESGRGQDNGLSEKGHRQASRVVKFYLDRELSDHPVLITSPKKRCIETLAPLAKELGIDAKIESRVGEGENLEGRVKAWLEQWKQGSDPLTVVCSHGDWIPVCVYQLTGAWIDISKGGWVEMEYGVLAGRTCLTWIVQKLK